MGLGNIVTKVGFSPDSSKIVTASSDGNARVYNVDTGELLHVLKGHKGPIWSISMQDIHQHQQVDEETTGKNSDS